MTTFIATTPSYGHPSALRRKLGFAPLCGAAAIPMAALKTPVAPEEGTTLDAFSCRFDVGHTKKQRDASLRPVLFPGF